MRRIATTATAFALAATTLAIPAQAVEVPTGACHDRDVPATPFLDTVRSPHRQAIDCAAWWGLTTGRTPTRFAPDAPITRGQTAAMVARLLHATGVAPNEVPAGGFVDTAGHRFEDDIDLLASLGIVGGVGGDLFAPDLAVTRAQMASILADTLRAAYDTPLPAAGQPFTDVHPTNAHRDGIARLAGAGIATGTSATTFAPAAPVRRAQMASFTTRTTSVLVAAGAATPPETRPGPDDAYASQTRAAWVHLFDPTLKTRAGIHRMVDEVADAGATTVIAQVARRHDAYYVSEVLPRTSDPTLTTGLDVLAEVLAAAHARDLEVQAWISVAPTWHDVYRDLPAPDGWVATEHGQNAPVAQRWVTRTEDGAWSDYLDPGVPAVQDHVAAVVGELVTRYDVDGVHLDYVRYPSARHGYNPAALAAYRAETGATATPSATSATFSAWRRQQTERVMQRARAAITGAGSTAQLTAAVITWGAGPASLDRAGFQGTLPYTRTLQDWDRWVRTGLVDGVMPMNYYRDHDAEQATSFARWVAYEEHLAASAAARVVPGIGGYLNHPARALAQVQTGNARADGATVYSYQQPTLDHSRAIFDQLAASRWGYAP